MIFFMKSPREFSKPMRGFTGSSIRGFKYRNDPVSGAASSEKHDLAEVLKGLLPY